MSVFACRRGRTGMGNEMRQKQFFKDLRENRDEYIANPPEPNPYFEWIMRIGSFVIGVLLPFIGLPLYFVWRDEKPDYAKYPGVGLLVGFSPYIFMLGRAIFYLFRTWMTM